MGNVPLVGSGDDYPPPPTQGSFGQELRNDMGGGLSQFPMETKKGFDYLNPKQGQVNSLGGDESDLNLSIIPKLI